MLVWFRSLQTAFMHMSSSTDLLYFNGNTHLNVWKPVTSHFLGFSDCNTNSVVSVPDNIRHSDFIIQQLFTNTSNFCHAHSTTDTIGHCPQIEGSRHLRIVSGDREDSSVYKTLCMWVQGPEFNPQHSHKKLDAGCTSVTPATLAVSWEAKTGELPRCSCTS